MAIYAIGATALTGGAAGCLDNEYVSGTPGILDKHVAFVLVQDDAVYHYIADATSGATADGVSVIKPLWQSVGVAYTGDLRWILHKVYSMIRSSPPAGGYSIDNIYLDASKHVVIRYNETPV